MGGPYKRKKYHAGDVHLKRGWRTKRRTKDLDMIDTDLAPDKAIKLLNQPTDLDLPGLGAFYCIHCAKHFIDTRAFQDHVKGKPHKRRMNALKIEPYTIEESERAAGMGSYQKPQKRKIETMFPEAMKKDDDTDQSTAKKAKMDEIMMKSIAKEVAHVQTMVPEVMKIDGETEEIAEMKA